MEQEDFLNPKQLTFWQSLFITRLHGATVCNKSSIKSEPRYSTMDQVKFAKDTLYITAGGKFWVVENFVSECLNLIKSN